MAKQRRSPASGAPEDFPVAVGAPHVELQALLKAVGAYESGGEAKHAIQAGEVRVNGTVEIRRSRKLVPGDLVAQGRRQWRVVGAPPSA